MLSSYGVVLLMMSPAFASTVSNDASAASPPRERVTEKVAYCVAFSAPDAD